jgi:hypothetical protein
MKTERSRPSSTAKDYLADRRLLLHSPARESQPVCIRRVTRSNRALQQEHRRHRSKIPVFSFLT